MPKSVDDSRRVSDAKRRDLPSELPWVPFRRSFLMDLGEFEVVVMFADGMYWMPE